MEQFSDKPKKIQSQNKTEYLQIKIYSLMGDYRLKTLSGEQVRNIYQFFEWEALKYADANNLPSNTDFLFGNSKEKFTVDINNNEHLRVFRHKNGKLIDAKKVYADAPVEKEKPVKTETTETTNNNTNMETKNNNTEIEKALQNLKVYL